MLSNFETPSKALRSLAAVAAGFFAIVAPAVGYGQVAARVLSPVDESSMVTLKGNISPLAQTKWDRGPAEDSISGRMLLVLKRTKTQDAALRQLVADQQDPNSANFHKWLTPTQFGQKFGVADADVESVTGYLRGQGFTVGRVYKNKSAIEVTGTAAQLRETFHTQIHKYEINGQEFYANVNEPQIPSALASVVRGFASLNNIKSSALIESPVSAAVSVPVEYNGNTHRVKPLYTGSDNTIASYLLAAADVQTIYGINTSTSSQGQGGNGITVGVVGDSQINVNLVSLYEKLMGTGSSTPLEIVDGPDPSIVSSTTGPDANIALEQLELITAAAPNAKLNYYTSAGATTYDTGLDFAIIRAIEDDAVSVLAIGAQTCEVNLTPLQSITIETAWLQASAEGITVVAATGDSGSAACDVPGVLSAANGLAVNGYASTPYNVAVGGTDFAYTSSTASNYWNSPGETATPWESAKGYIPEQAWNDSIQTGDIYAGTGLSYVHAGGGGYSTAGSIGSDGVTKSAYPSPSWQISTQTASGLPTTARSIPDVAMFAGDAYNEAAYAVCSAPTDCNGYTVTAIGGTAASAGVFAGIMAQVVQAHGLQGNANFALYYLRTKQPAVFHTSQAGTTNSLVCTTGSANCTGGYIVQSNGTNAYTVPALSGTATPYNLVTGLGSVNAASLISSWAIPATTSTSTQLTVSSGTNVAYASGASIVHGSYVNFKAAIMNASGSALQTTATGNVGIMTGSLLPNENGNIAIPVVSGIANTYPNNYDDLLVGGTYTLTARYSGDGTFLPSTSTFNLTVTPETSRMLYWNGTALSATNTTTAVAPKTIIYGTPFPITVEPFSLNNNDVSIPTGTVGVYSNGSEDPLNVLPLSSEGTITFTTNNLTGGTYSLQFDYAGDPSFQPSNTTNPYYVTVNPIATHTSVYSDTVYSTLAGQATATVSPGLAIACGTQKTGVQPAASAAGFVVDPGATNGTVFPNPIPATSITIPSYLVNAAPPIVYTTGTQAPAFTYTLGGFSAGANYTVVLHFSELYFNAAAKREFNVAINGNPALTNFDIYVAAGYHQNTAVIETFPNITANASGQIVIAFTTGAQDQPLVAGIEVQTSTGVPPTGTVTFSNTNGTLSGTPSYTYGFSYTGQPIEIATLAITSAQAKVSAITASYGGDSNYASSSGNLTITPVTSSTAKGTSTLTITPSTTNVTTAGPLTLTATVTESDNTTPNGTVFIYANGISVGSFNDTSTSGQAFSIPLTNGSLPFASGTVSFTAVYVSKATGYGPATASTTVFVTDARATGDFSIGTDIQFQTITSSSNYAYFKAELASLQNFGGLTNPITLTCAIFPANSNLGCTLAQTSVNVGSSGTAVVAFNVFGRPTGGTGELKAPITPTHWWLVGGGSALACVFLFGIPARRRGMQSWLGAVLCVVVISGSITGCGANRVTSDAAISGSGSQTKGGSVSANYTNGLAPSTPTVAPGNYTVVITGTATTNTTLVHNTAVTVTVSTGVALANANYTFTNFASQGLLTDPAASVIAGTGLVQDPADGTSDQAWTFTYQNNGYYTIKNKANGLFLTDPNGGSGVVQVTQQNVITPTDGTQLWTLQSLEGGFEVVNANSGCVLDDDDFNIAAGTEVICYPQKGIPDAINQTWYIQQVP